MPLIQGNTLGLILGRTRGRLGGGIGAWWKAFGGTQPGLALEFANDLYMAGGVTRSFSGAVDFTRASDGTFYDNAGILKTAITDVARFDHDPFTGASLGLVREAEQTNLFTRTTLLGGPPPTGWSSSEVSGGTVDFLTSKAGGIANAVQVETAGGGARAYITVSSGVVFAPDTTYTVSVFVEQSRIAAGLQNGMKLTNLSFILSGSAVLTLLDGDIGLKSMTFTTDGVGGTAQIRLGSGLSGGADASIRMSLPRVDKGTFPTSFTPTSASTVTRKADLISLVTGGGDPFPSYNHAEGTWVAYVRSRGGLGRIVAGSGSEAVLAFQSTGFECWSGSVNLVINDGGTNPADGNLHKVAVGYDATGRILGMNGLTPVTDAVSPYVNTTPTLFPLGARNGGGSPSNMWFDALYWYPKKFTAAEIQEVTL